jgi:biofilm PGA synthesis lipoprotein PgaB
MALLIRSIWLWFFFTHVAVAQLWHSPDFLALAYHEIDENGQPVSSNTALTEADLAAQFEWLRRHDYHPVSLSQILDARAGLAPLPDNAILLSFDDGRRDVYTRAYPLLRQYAYPALIALVGSWLDAPLGSTVDYDGQPVARTEFLDWAEIREMQASGLVEVASHSYALHTGIVANPQGNTLPAAIARHYHGGGYENESQYRVRILADLERNNRLIAEHTGHPPRAMVWPYGRSSVLLHRLAEQAGLPVGLTLEGGHNAIDVPSSALQRTLIQGVPSLSDFAAMVRARWVPNPVRALTLPDIRNGSNDELSSTLDALKALKPNRVFLRPGHFTHSGWQTWFANTQWPVSADVLSHWAWQIERRAGVSVYLDIPLDWLSQTALIKQLATQINFVGVRLPVAPDSAAAKAALTELRLGQWPVNVVYAPSIAPDARACKSLDKGDRLQRLAGQYHSDIPATEVDCWLWQFDADGDKHVVARMHQMEAEGFGHFSLDSRDIQLPPALFRAFSLRTLPIKP